MPAILEQIQSELVSEMRFYHKGVKNITRPGSPHRVDDAIEFELFVLNGSPIPVKSLSGWCKHAPATAFTAVNFSVPVLKPGEEKSLGAIKARVVANTNDLIWFDKIALIDAVAFGDLSSIRFADTGVLVDNIQPA